MTQEIPKTGYDGVQPKPVLVGEGYRETYLWKIA
jgi:hypothetical protein